MFKHNEAFSGFSVDDIEKARQFYGKTLGMEVTDGQMGLLELHIANGSKVVVYSKPNHVPATFTILNLPVADIDNAVDQLTRAGVRFEIYNMPDLKTDERGIARGQGPAIAWFKDPAGNFLSIIQSE